MAEFVEPDRIRAAFALAMSDMYRAEVPQYGALVALVEQINADVLARDPELAVGLERAGGLDRLSGERHGAIRVGTAEELRLCARAFAVMGMEPVGYYDLAPAGVPVHSTAFRPVDPAALARNPFRLFTSLLRLELIADDALRAEAAAILARRQIVTSHALALIEQAERDGGLDEAHANRFVVELLETFRWHARATVDAQTYAKLLASHRLVADVVSFRGPHINHLTPRTLDIDAAQAAMPAAGIAPKENIEGPPRRRCPVLLRQTSFKALDEAIDFDGVVGRHLARFGEIEQRGVALTPKGRALYDALLARGGDAFADLPDDWDVLRREGLAYFAYTPTEKAGAPEGTSLDSLVSAGHVAADPIIYEDFLPVSAAGIFQSNLGDAARAHYQGQSSKAAFEAALGRPVIDEFALYAAQQAASIAALAL
ncbi:VOC family protein [Sphingomonas montanisoli]|uniref:2-oxoadipate dioxygenase/decarboxylase n=1 Tax=Sphingomonas montanisoli TaxID=2606412 RepID=A0A5D9CFW7_9SPHN|nr:VOC family protein [Sphingomonas montanisoli]TZG29051.1 VOC family protein [Sphingomonas montanisoli]